MSEKPSFNESVISNFLKEQYGINSKSINPLSGGADQNASVFRVGTQDSTYFLKARKGEINTTPLLIQQFLHAQGIEEVLEPLETKDHKPFSSTGGYNYMLYPFIEGKSNAEVSMSDINWIGFGKALKKIHETNLPKLLKDQLPKETFSSRYPDTMITLLKKIVDISYSDPIVSRTADFLLQKNSEITSLVEKTNKLRELAQSQNLPFVLCHSDIHAGNRFVSTDGKLTIIDFDEPVLAPKERDLMYLGSGIIQTDTPQEIASFYQGYGQTEVSNEAIAYFRCRRIIEDIVLFSEDIFSGNVSGEDNETNFGYLTSNFLPGGVFEIANQTQI